MSVTKDIAAATAQAEAQAKIKDIHDKQRIEAENYEESLRIQREEGAYAQHMHTRTANFGAYQVEKQAEVGVAGAEALGQMGANGAGTIDLGNGGGGMGFNPAAMMASMAVGGVVGQNIAGAMSNAMAGMNGAAPGAVPPPVPVTAYPVGMVRVIGDGGMSFYIKDFAVIPSYQGKGVGKCLMEALERYVKECKPLDWAVSLELISSKEAVNFYKKYGFEERPCDWDGPGMFKMVR